MDLIHQELKQRELEQQLSLERKERKDLEKQMAIHQLEQLTQRLIAAHGREMPLLPLDSVGSPAAFRPPVQKREQAQEEAQVQVLLTDQASTATATPSKRCRRPTRWPWRRS